MIVVDTNVVSEALRATPDHHVIAWLDAQPLDTLFLTSISFAELSLGLATLPAGRRRADFEAAVFKAISELFADRILPFDLRAAESYAHIVCTARAKGHTMSMPDAQIASIAATHDFDIATRDKGFAQTGRTIINPWAYRG